VKLEEISDVLISAHTAALRRRGATIDLPDLALAVVQLTSSEPTLSTAHIDPPDAATSPSGAEVLRLEAATGGAMPVSANLRRAIDDLPHGITRGRALTLLFESALQSGRVSVPASIAKSVRDALRAADLGKAEGS